MSGTVKGLIDWGLSLDDEGHRNYNAEFLVRMDDKWDGPGAVLNTPGLPIIGSAWNMGNDSDPWAFCWPNAKISKAFIANEPDVYWKAGFMFTTKPLKRCQDTTIEDPMSEPYRIGGSFVTKTKEVMLDRNGKAIKTSSHELIRGQISEFDDSCPTVKIGMNLLILPLSDFAPMIHTVNDAPMWGLLPRMIKLSNATWQRQIYGTCTYYYTVDYDFEINYKTFDRKAVDEGTRILAPGGDPNDPRDFVAYKDARQENARVLLDGSGAPLGDADAPVEIPIEYYDEGDLLALGLPASF